MSDFEVTVDKKVIGLSDGTGRVVADGVEHQASLGYGYKAFTGYKGLTLVRDQPVFLALDGTVDAAYNGEKLRAISAGIDSSLWGIL